MMVVGMVLNAADRLDDSSTVEMFAALSLFTKKETIKSQVPQQWNGSRREVGSGRGRRGMRLEQPVGSYWHFHLACLLTHDIIVCEAEAMCGRHVT